VPTTLLQNDGLPLKPGFNASQSLDRPDGEPKGKDALHGFHQFARQFPIPQNLFECDPGTAKSSPVAANLTEMLPE
jgi:hypothetical protein